MENSRKETMQKVLEIVAQETNTSVRDIVSKGRQRPIADARKIFCNVMRSHQETTYSLKEVGAFINRDHPTTLFSCRAAENVSKTDKRFANALNRVRNRVFNTSPSEVYNNVPQL
ncbi:helix-turn-helix domain-containing protein [Aurantibacillus circumpalustris]|uniref:helix-turn-helix domain-containing protein n=1 Tax=Aurantibacillus circumpalustris TaxID=3036359 RepID=UPI00295B5888|nr:helix-turn-helix domain-containing protein [Aurantibacillus circumpalustris]